MKECDRWERKLIKDERETENKKEKQRNWCICACVTVCSGLLAE